MIVDYRGFNEYWFRDLPIQKRRAGNPGTKKSKFYYKDVITAFDIETSTLKDINQSFMYIWQWQFADQYTVIGRTWDEFLAFCDILNKQMKPDEKLCVFIHNASFEFQFIRGIYQFKPSEVFAVDSRKVLKFSVFDRIEFRCSYLHSNMSLKEYTERMGAPHSKLSGAEFDYSKLRYPWTPLSERELEYCINDVLGLVEAITIEMNHDGDNLYSFPLTSTGYVRRDAKRAMRRISHFFVPNQLSNYHIYEMCSEAFRGGNTHANRFYAGKILHDVKSADRSSSYPDVQCNCKFPISAFTEIGSCAPEYLSDLINRRGKAVLMRVKFWGIRLSDEYWGCPYLSRDKCRRIIGGVFDNGRILEAEYLETTITDIDFRIILEEYSFDNFQPYDVAHARYGVLPKVLIDTIISYYKAKTELKGIEGEEIFYMKSKNKLNSIYGMSAQDPVKESILFTDGLFILDTKTPQELLEESNKRAFMPYQWGVWTTAWSRYRLEEGIRLAGDGFVYCDTDSVKYVGDIDWSEYNAQREADSIRSGAHATDPKGTEHYMGVYEYEGCYSEFATLGAKKYCYREEGKPLKVTIAGVSKKEGGPELEKHGGITAFKPGFIFRDAGGTESVYNDFPEHGCIHIDGHDLPITSNVVIQDSTYTLGITAEYEMLLTRSSLTL